MTWAEVGFTAVSASDVKYKDQVCVLLKLHPKSRTRISSATHPSLHRFPTSSIMKVITLAALLATAASVFALPAPAATSGSATVSYDQVYDNKSGSLDTVACSNGPNGLETKGTLSQVCHLYTRLTLYA